MRAVTAIFEPAAWLRGPHLQTVWGRVGRSRRLIDYRREVLTTPDGDELIVDHADAERTDIRVVFLHGLEGSSYSTYIQGMVALFGRHGIPATVMNYRSCARDPRNVRRMIPNRRPRLYHSGETSDFDFLVRTLRAREPERRLAAVGVSMGGNVLLKWMGENPDQKSVVTGVAISTPFDLGAGARHLELGLGAFYTASFLRSLKSKARSAVERFALARERIDLPRALRARTFFAFDDAATGPYHEFTGAPDYYARSSSLGFVGKIATPVLCISAEDDPFLPRRVLDAVREAKSDSVELVTTACGGHTGFVSGRPWACRYWAEERAVGWVVENAPK
ncbi:MAG: YheT family hydrolase [Thermoanaerobaculia bacterium]